MVSIEFGALCAQIEEQLNKQGFSISADDSYRLQRIADAIITLKLARVIPDSVTRNAEQKLMKLIGAAESLAEDNP